MSHQMSKSKMDGNLNYFVCTLGQAAVLAQGDDLGSEKPKPFSNIPDFVEEQARLHPNLPAVGFYQPCPDTPKSWTRQILTFEDVARGVCVIADILSEELKAPSKQTVALLCPSSPEFMFMWLALMRLDHPVLLIAPQCSASAIAALCRSCEVSVLIYDDVYRALAQEACAEATKACGNGTPESRDAHSGIEPLKALTLSSSVGDDIFQTITRTPAAEPISVLTISQTDIAYLHHTSGTSTGIPKPIPQSHRAGVGVLPRLDGSKAATFTTTPLYHGGIADLFRAWTSNALIWLFPGKEIPITAKNVVTCLDIAAEASDNEQAPPVRYFSSVPYVLQMMASDPSGLKHLQGMDAVGVGGAALPAVVGDDLIRQHVNLVSRFGSAECGFLMSSHRDYANDTEWQYLRPSEGSMHLRFEKQGDTELYELVIMAGWPHMAKQNREDGSYATADQFAPHSIIPDAWKYHSRTDSQLTLITGKKFDPAPLEAAITASSKLLGDVLIFGNGKPYPGALLFRSAESASTSDEEIIREIALTVEKLNRESQSHARIPRNMLVPIHHRDGSLMKSSKGTILRNKAEERYQEPIEEAYKQVMFDGHKAVADPEVESVILRAVDSIVGSSPGDHDALKSDTDLFAYGVDSVACVQIRHCLSQLLSKAAPALPLTVVEDAGSVASLADMVIRLRHGKPIASQIDQCQLMRDLVKEYGNFASQSSCHQSDTNGHLQSPGKTILLTGPTGSLGSHVLHQLLSLPATYIKQIYLLIRGATPHAARERVLKALRSRSLPVPANFADRVTILPCNLASSDLGLSAQDYQNLSTNVDIILHLAWTVNFLLPLRSFQPQFSGLRNLINLALSTPSGRQAPKFIFCSSVASVANYSSIYQTTATIPEHNILDPRVSGPTGYSHSKWVAEQICHAAHTTTRLKDRISFVRVGQLSGDTRTGVWSKTEAYPLLLSSALVTGVLPDLGPQEKLNWIPVDVAATAFIESACGSSTTTPTSPHPSNANDKDDGSATVTEKENNSSEEPRIHHVVYNNDPASNSNRSLTWLDLLTTLSKHEQDNEEDHRQSFKIVDIPTWLNKLESLTRNEETKNHSSLKLFGFWREIYGSRAKDQAHTPDDNQDENKTKLEEETSGAGVREAGYEMEQTYRDMPIMRTVGKHMMKEEYLIKMWAWIKENVS